MKKLSRIILVEAINLRKKTVLKLEPLFSGGLLLRKLSYELEFSKYLSCRSTMPESEVSLLTPFLTMDIVFLSKLLENIIARCSIMMSEVVGLKISAKIDPELAMVRIDRKLFQTILIDATMLAIRNIKDSIRYNPRKQGFFCYFFHSVVEYYYYL
jgi:hypothetical protein